ncbi:MAG: N-acetylneuraminate synthase [Methanomicrobiaceae archaeon]|nr:N-acetylneuraminate synthase [Methanomicrobiaceae archaeon]
MGEGEKCFIIAEAGVNHNGNLNLAKQLVDVAAESGADAVKFQTFRAESLASKNAEKADYQIESTSEDESQYYMLKKLELSYQDFRRLSDYTKEKNLIFLSTPFDEESASFLEEIGIPAYKISSGEITNLPLLKLIAKNRKPVILSTGMSTLCEVEKAVVTLKKNGSENIVILHCTTSYPAAFESVNLSAMNTMKYSFRLPVGYSDHTIGVTIPIAAAAMGAAVIEKHFTLDKSLLGPDHKASLDPSELKEMIQAIRNVEKAIGTGIKKRTEEEKKIILVARKSIVAGRDIHKGEVVREKDLKLKRPGNGIPPEYLNEIAGKKAQRNLIYDEQIKWEDII